MGMMPLPKRIGYAAHLAATFGTRPAEARMSNSMGFAVAARMANTIAARPGSARPTHPPAPALTATPRSVTASKIPAHCLVSSSTQVPDAHRGEHVKRTATAPCGGGDGDALHHPYHNKG
jgi:hypothetical protein